MQGLCQYPTQSQGELSKLVSGAQERLAAAFSAHPHQHLQPISSVRSATARLVAQSEATSYCLCSDLVPLRSHAIYVNPFKLGFPFCPHLAVSAAHTGKELRN